ncbi:MAG: sodium-dependent transporter [Oligoflexales bacterium]
MTFSKEPKILSPHRGAWSNRLGLILAASGSAVGLGNVWKFPYITGVNGGGAFVLVYLLALVLIALPALLSELYIGQKGQASAVQSFKNLDHDKSFWRFAGGLGVCSSILIYSYYSVVGGWIFYYFMNSVNDIWLVNCNHAVSCTKFADVLGQPLWQLGCQFTFLSITGMIVARGVSGGIERFNKFLMPLFMSVLLFMFVNCVWMSGFSDAIHFLLVPDFSKLSATSILEAFGHSFFTISIGVGIMVTYGSYLAPDEKILPVAITVICLDTCIALISGIIVFSVVFTFHGEPGSGPSLLFETLPALFQYLPYGHWISMIFFSLIAITALTSSISLLEVGTSWLTERYPNTPRPYIVLFLSLVCFLLGSLCSLSFNLLSEYTLIGMTAFDFLDVATGRVFLPLAGVMTLLFFGWVLGRPASLDVIGEDTSFSSYFLWLTRTVSPFVVMIVMIAALL